MQTAFWKVACYASVHSSERSDATSDGSFGPILAIGYSANSDAAEHKNNQAANNRFENLNMAHFA